MEPNNSSSLSQYLKCIFLIFALSNPFQVRFVS
jgi:hypothetical protein